MAVSKRLRFEILRRDNHACRYCGATAPEVKLTVDHVVPTALGGNDEPTNLVACCAGCNSGKSSSSPDSAIVADVAEDALRWSAAMRRAADLQRQESDRIRGACWSVETIWNRWKLDADGSNLPLPSDWEDSIRRLLAAGMDESEFDDTIRMAMHAHGVMPENRWRYFCGICWRRLEDRQSIAREILEGER